MKRALELLVACALALACALPARAAVQETRMGGVSMRVETPWPGSVRKGYFPTWIELNNEEGGKQTIEVQVRCEQWREASCLARTRVSLAPGEKRAIELFVPCFYGASGAGLSDYSVRLVVGNSSNEMSLRTSGDDGDFAVLVVTPERLPAGTPDAIGERLSETRTVKALAPAKDRTPSRRVFVATPSGSSATTAHPVQTSVVDPGRLPATYHGFTGLDVVVLDVRRGLPPDEKLGPLLAWVRLGGKLAVFGPGVLETLRGLEGDGGWFEERFVRETLAAGPVFDVGLGSVLASGLDPGADILAESTDVDSVAGLLVSRARGGWIPDPRGWRLGARVLAIPGLERLPLRIFLFLLLLFAILIGPVNLILIKRFARPAMLLVSIPVISILSSVGILAYGILYQGIETQAASESLTVLDQRSHRSATVERRALFVGLSRESGLQPRPGTSVFPSRPRHDSDVYELDFEDGLLLRGTFLPVRDPVEQMILTEGNARARLEFELKEGRALVQNTFEVPIERLVLCDPDGGLHYSDRTLEPGEATVLDPAEPTSDTSWFMGGELVMLGPQTDLRPATYLALIGRSPFTDDCGLDLTTLSQVHCVHGILPAEAKDW